MSSCFDEEHYVWPSVTLSFSITGGSLKVALSFGAEDSSEEPVVVGFLTQTAPCLNSELHFQ